MADNGRTILRNYYDEASRNYLERASKGLMGWMRRRELQLTEAMIPEAPHCRSLDAGCGPCFYSEIMRNRGHIVTAIDLSPEMVAIAKKKGFPAYVMDIESGEQPEGLGGPFDFVFCAGVLEFAIEPERFLRSLRKMTKDNGRLALVAPHRGMFGAAYTAYLAVKGIPAKCYTADSVEKMLKASGFEVIDTSYSWPICLAVEAKAVPDGS